MGFLQLATAECSLNYGRAGRVGWTTLAMNWQYLIGELSVRLEQLQATSGQAAAEVARLLSRPGTG